MVFSALSWTDVGCQWPCLDHCDVKALATLYGWPFVPLYPGHGRPGGEECSGARFGGGRGHEVGGKPDTHSPPVCHGK